MPDIKETKTFKKIAIKSDKLEKYIPERFPSVNEINDLLLKDKDTATAFLVWLTGVQRDNYIRDYKEAYEYALRIINEADI